MAKVIETKIIIQASAESIWAILTDFKSYPKWNPFITSLRGEVAVGNRIRMRLEPPNATAMTFTPKILTKIDQKEFSWQGHLFIKGLFDGRHKFEIVDNGNQTCTFVHSEQFNGLLIPLLSSMLDKNTKEGFIAMNLKLKELAEAKN